MRKTLCALLAVSLVLTGPAAPVGMAAEPQKTANQTCEEGAKQKSAKKFAKDVKKKANAAVDAAKMSFEGLTRRQKLLAGVGTGMATIAATLGIAYREELKNSKLGQHVLKFLGCKTAETLNENDTKQETTGSESQPEVTVKTIKEDENTVEENTGCAVVTTQENTASGNQQNQNETNGEENQTDNAGTTKEIIVEKNIDENAETIENTASERQPEVTVEATKEDEDTSDDTQLMLTPINVANKHPQQRAEAQNDIATNSTLKSDENILRQSSTTNSTDWQKLDGFVDNAPQNEVSSSFATDAWSWLCDKADSTVTVGARLWNNTASVAKKVLDNPVARGFMYVDAALLICLGLRKTAKSLFNLMAKKSGPVAATTTATVVAAASREVTEFIKDGITYIRANENYFYYSKVDDFITQAQKHIKDNFRSILIKEDTFRALYNAVKKGSVCSRRACADYLRKLEPKLNGGIISAIPKILLIEASV